MVGLALLLGAWAAPVQCDPDQAFSLLTEARIDERRAPISHPELMPGLALASTRTSPELRDALVEMCAGEPDLSLVPAEMWEDREWSAHTFLLTRTDTEGCALETRTLAVSVGVDADGPRYSLRDATPASSSVTPLGDCAVEPTWTEEKVVGGEGAATRLILATTHELSGVTSARVLARRAQSSGWQDVVIADPAPPRLLDPEADGPRVAITEIGERWIVQTQSRSSEGGCHPVAGQVVWTPTETGWNAIKGAEALRLLGSRGLWRYAGSDGWVAVVAQDDEEDLALVEARMRRLETRNQKDLQLLYSSWFPELNPGFVIAVLGPYATEEEAKSALKKYRGGARRYVKRAWMSVNPCAPG
ncbi:MAG: hypothetical protein KC912_12820 [Proteobacteria bacterium]|nr:hypothetical protein [Pseudomonadota bacterium]